MINPNAILEIDKKNLIHNYKYLLKLSIKSICAPVIKANAYGLGDLEIIKILLKEGCKHFFIATTEEGIKIRKKNNKAILYVLNGLEGNSLEVFKKYKLIPILNSKEEINILLKNEIYNSKFKYGIHIETGLNRLSINLENINKNIFKKKNLEIIISHLASGEELNNIFNIKQNNNFIKNCKLFKNIKYKSLCSSAGLMNNKNYIHEMVRPGISLYGCADNIELLKKNDIRPVITLKGKILQIKKIKKNEFVGYNQTYKTKKITTVAIIGIGYADGVSRQLSNNGKLYYKKESFNIIGRVSMDSITVDITNCKIQIKVGKYMELINKKYTAEKMAIKLNTISNEILTSISQRVKRVYK